MKTGIGSIIIRKIVTTFVAALIFSAILSFFSLNGSSEILFNKGNLFIGWFIVYFMYIGVIMLIYGSIVSIGIEYLQRKWFQQHDWLYVLILGVFGLANGLFFEESTFAFLGMLAAISYAIIDKWIYKRYSRRKSVKYFVLIPMASLLICWGYFQLTSPPMPPFTKDDAVVFATSGEDTVIDHFPKEIGKWEGTIDGYQVIRETNAEEIGEETFLVTFKENWSTKAGSGSWSLSYKVDRESLTAYGEKGIIPPYYEGK